MGTILMAGGGLAESGKEDEICEAFAAAVDDWCKKTPNTIGREFADVFGDKTKDIAGLADSITREAPLLMKMVGAVPVVVGMLAAVAGAPGGDQAAASSIQQSAKAEGIQAIETVDSAGGAAGAFRQAMNRVAAAFDGGRFSFKYPDGELPGGQLLEIKGPGDVFKPGQAEAYNAQSVKASGKDLAVASCESCPNAACPPNNAKCR